MNSRPPYKKSKHLILIKVTINSKTNKLNLNKQKMRKVIAIFAIATTLVACGGKGTSEATTDSTVVAVDSAVVNADSTAAPVADTTIAK